MSRRADATPEMTPWRAFGIYLNSAELQEASEVWAPHLANLLLLGECFKTKAETKPDEMLQKCTLGSWHEARCPSGPQLVKETNSRFHSVNVETISCLGNLLWWVDLGQLLRSPPSSCSSTGQG